MIELPVPLVLASASETRRRLLARIAREFEVVPPDVEECDLVGKPPEDMVRELARRKARQVARQRPDALVVAADTVAVCDGEIIGKPEDRADALRTLRKLTRRPHRVLTGICVRAADGTERLRCIETEIRMRRLSEEQLRALSERDGALQRAGAYALQPDDPNVVRLEGSETAVMGLPLEELEEMIRELYPSG
ncbi:MAG: Maf family protein [Planctomycetota bacterium]